jgi:hypothetical protein
MHVLRVVSLWKEKYNTPGPFVIPDTPSKPTDPPRERISAAPVAAPSVLEPDTTSIKPTIPSKYRPPPTKPQPASAPILTHTASGSSKAAPVRPPSPPSPIKLRHPKRLHTRDLTDNTFRIYIKHYMDRIADVSALESCEVVQDQAAARGAGKRRTVAFALSHLRRVPELSALARMVVVADERRKRRREEDIGKDKTNSQERRTSGGGKGARTGDKGKGRGAERTRDVDVLERERERAKRRHKIKQLYRWAVVELYREGSIVLRDPDAEDEVYVSPPSPSANEGALWKSGKSSDDGPSSVRGKVSSTARGSAPEDDDGDVSDAPPGEEAYVSLTPGYLGVYVRRALGVLVHGRAASSRPANGVESISAEDITRYLQRSDGRWERVGEWGVKAALKWLKDEGGG